MLVCISYTHPYSTKSLNHTSPFRKCKLYFGANMQVASTIWPDIKSQKISEQRFRLKWTKCSPRTNPNKVKTGQPQRGSDKEAQDSLPEEVGGGWWHEQAGRPTWSADLAPWAPPPQPGHVASPHWSPTPVVMSSPRGSLL